MVCFNCVSEENRCHAHAPHRGCRMLCRGDSQTPRPFRPIVTLEMEKCISPCCMSLTANAALNDTTQIKEIASCARHPRRMQPLVGAGVPDFTYFTRSVGGVSPLFIVRCEKAGAGRSAFYRRQRRYMLVLAPRLDCCGSGTRTRKSIVSCFCFHRAPKDGRARSMSPCDLGRYHPRLPFRHAASLGLSPNFRNFAVTTLKIYEYE